MSHPPRSPRCPIRTHFLPLWVCSLLRVHVSRSPSFLSALVYDLLLSYDYQDGCLMALAKGALPEEYLSQNFDEQCLGGH